MIFIVIFVMQLLIASDEFHYNIKIKGINAGTALLKSEYYSNEKYKISFIAKSNKLIDFFYKLRENTVLIVDSNFFSIYELNQSIRQGKYKKQTYATVDYESQIIHYNNKEIEFEQKIYSPLSLIYYLKDQNLLVNKKFNFQIFENGKIKNINVDVIRNETIQLHKEFMNCHVLNIQVLNNEKEFDNIMTLYISDSQIQQPVMIKSKIKQGEMVLTIK